LWFKQDLRVDDHPGLAWAIQRDQGMLPLWCLDPLSLPAIPPPMLHSAVMALRASLKALGSNLIVRVGAPEDVLPKLAKEMGAGLIITEEEVEYRWRAQCSSVQASLAKQGVSLVHWGTPLWEGTQAEVSEERPQGYSRAPALDNFREFQKIRGKAIPPMAPPLSMPTVKDIDEGAIPSVDTIDAAGRYLWVSGSVGLGSENVMGWRAGRMEVELDLEKELNGKGLEDVVGGGCQQAMEKYKGYLAYSSSRSEPAWDLLDSTVRLFEQRPETSFTRLFSAHLAAGVLSRRRVHQLATQHEADNFSYFQAFPAREAKACVEGSDFSRLLAMSDNERVTEVVNSASQEKVGLTGRYWMWRGHLIQYLVMAPEGLAENDAPALLLIHGFGAMSEHYRRNVSDLAKEFTVYVPTVIGFGRCEKPLIDYTQNLWTEMLRDFVLEVVQRPTAAVGNSIGGIFAAKLAADYNHLVTGVVMLNPAGAVNMEYSPPEVAPPRPVPNRVVVHVACSLLLAYLERDIKGILQRCYVHNPEGADDWLAGEIYRAACDPNAMGVFKSSFYLPKPEPLNHLLDKFPGPMLLLQGQDDPLNDAKARAKSLTEACPRLEVELIIAGHCPHDEVPSIVNLHISDWMNRAVIGENVVDFDDPVSIA